MITNYERILDIFLKQLIPLTKISINNKYWSPVSRIDNVYGDRNLFCVCPPIDEYEEEKTG